MNEQNTKKLFNRFKFFHPEKTLMQSLMGFGFECGDGWFELIYKLCEDIEELGVDDGFEVMQVKEKFGGLRFYTNYGTEKVYSLIEKAENKSFKICEVCGKPGRPRGNGWITTLCDEHAKTSL